MATSTDATTGTSATPKPPLNSNSWRAKWVQFWMPSKLFNEPFMRLGGTWGEANINIDKAPQTDEGRPVPVSAQISAMWRESLKQSEPDEIDIVKASRLKALIYEKKHPEIPTDQRLLPDARRDGKKGKTIDLFEPLIPSKITKGPKETYDEAIHQAFLETVGEDDFKTFMDSLKEAGTGGLHRHDAAMLTAVGNVVNSISQLVPQKPVQAALTGVRFLFAMAAGERAMASWDPRVGNSQTEELMVAGRADAPPSAKTGTDILGAARHLPLHTKKTVRLLKAATEKLADARKTGDENAVLTAERELRRLHAQECHEIAARDTAKHTIEAMKVELIGNKRYIQTSLSGASLTSGSGLFSILKPKLGAIATGTVSAGASVAALGLYLTYHFSTMPSDDGVRKALRAIIALAKSSDLFNDERSEFDTRRAQEYEKFQSATSKAGKDEAARTLAEQAFDDALLDIELDERDAKPPISQEQNWKNYSKHVAETHHLTGTDKAAADKAYADAHRADFMPKVIAGAWKDPISMRIDTGRKLLSGKIAQAHKQLLKLEEKSVTAPTYARYLHPFSVTPQEKKEKKERLVAELQQALADLLNLDAAEKEIKKASKLPLDDAEELLAASSRYLDAIQDQDFRDLFCGDTKAQVAASKKAKLFTIGEGERYKWTTYGSTLPTLVTSAAVMGTSTILGGLRAENAHVADQYKATHPDATPAEIPVKFNLLEYDDFKFLAIQSLGASINGHYNAQTRAKIRDVDLKALLKIVDKEVSNFTGNLPWPENGPLDKKNISQVIAKLVEKADDEDEDLSIGNRVFDDEERTGLLSALAQESTDASKPQTFTDALKDLLATMALEEGFTAKLNASEDTAPLTIADLKSRVTELMKKQSLAAILGLNEKDTANLSADEIQEHAITLMERKISFLGQVDKPEGGTFSADDMGALVQKLLEREKLPPKLVLNFPKSPSDSSAKNPLKADFEISLEKTTPFRRMQYLQSSFGERFSFRWNETGIVGRQMLIALAGIPAHMWIRLARVNGVSLDEMKAARDEAAAMLKAEGGTDPNTNALAKWVDDLGGAIDSEIGKGSSSTPKSPKPDPSAEGEAVLAETEVKAETSVRKTPSKSRVVDSKLTPAALVSAYRESQSSTSAINPVQKANPRRAVAVRASDEEPLIHLKENDGAIPLNSLASVFASPVNRSAETTSAGRKGTDEAQRTAALQAEISEAQRTATLAATLNQLPSPPSALPVASSAAVEEPEPTPSSKKEPPKALLEES